jgi:hypothetical protein
MLLSYHSIIIPQLSKHSTLTAMKLAQCWLVCLLPSTNRNILVGKSVLSLKWNIQSGSGTWKVGGNQQRWVFSALLAIARTSECTRVLHPLQALSLNRGNIYFLVTLFRNLRSSFTNISEYIGSNYEWTGKYGHNVHLSFRVRC